MKIDSTTPHESRVSAFLEERLSQLMIPFPGKMERIEVDPGRWNVFARWGEPVVTLSTHMDTVPPFVSFREDEEFIWGRGACDAKGIIASMILAAESLLREGVRSLGLLFVMGEERDGAGAIAAGKLARGSHYLINGEPTENKMVRGSKGALRYEIRTSGRTAHSAYTGLSHSAIEDLLAWLNHILRIPLAHDPLLGSSTLNIGTLTGGCAPNIVPDFAAADPSCGEPGDSLFSSAQEVFMWRIPRGGACREAGSPCGCRDLFDLAEDVARRRLRWSREDQRALPVWPGASDVSECQPRHTRMQLKQTDILMLTLSNTLRRSLEKKWGQP